jgi:hypothetical protein
MSTWQTKKVYWVGTWSCLVLTLSCWVLQFSFHTVRLHFVLKVSSFEAVHLMKKLHGRRWTYVVGSKIFRADQLFKVKQLCYISIYSPFISTQFYHLWTSNTMPFKRFCVSLSAFPFGAAFIYQVGNIWTLLLIYKRRGLFDTRTRHKIPLFPPV